jgi:hypothetical protein
MNSKNGSTPSQFQVIQMGRVRLGRPIGIEVAIGCDCTDSMSTSADKRLIERYEIWVNESLESHLIWV